MARVIAVLAAATTRAGGTSRWSTRPRSAGVVRTAGVDRIWAFLPIVPSSSSVAAALGVPVRALGYGLELPFSAHLNVHQKGVGRPLHTNDTEFVVLLWRRNRLSVDRDVAIGSGVSFCSSPDDSAGSSVGVEAFATSAWSYSAFFFSLFVAGQYTATVCGVSFLSRNTAPVGDVSCNESKVSDVRDVNWFPYFKYLHAGNLS